MDEPTAPSTATTPDEEPVPQGHESLCSWFNEVRGRRAGPRLLGKTAATVSGWGRVEHPVRPSDPFDLFAIAEITGIPVYAWLRRSEFDRLQPVLQNMQLLVQHVARRAKTDPRQIHIDEYLAQQAADLPDKDPFDSFDAAMEAAMSETTTPPPPAERGAL
jgi:hypothetical protein